MDDIRRNDKCRRHRFSQNIRVNWLVMDPDGWGDQEQGVVP
jgi:hypothetical protein